MPNCHFVVCVHFTCVLRADHGPIQPGPGPSPQITEFELDRARLGDEGRQAQWPWGKFFQSGWVESDIRDIRLCQRNNKRRQHVQRVRVSVVLASSHPETHVLHPVFWETMEDVTSSGLQQEQGREGQLRGQYL